MQWSALQGVAPWTTGACMLLVPLTHGCLLHSARHSIAGPRCHKPATVLRHVLLFPLSGGIRYFAFCLLGWVLWGLSAAPSLPLWPHAPFAHPDVLRGCQATTSFISLVFLLQASLCYEPKHHPPTSPVSSSGSSVQGGAMGAVRRQARLSLQGAKRYGAVLAVVLIGLLCSVTGTLLLLSVEHMPDMPSRVLYCCLALVCLIIAASSTHGLGGYLAWAAAAASVRISSSCSSCTGSTQSTGSPAASPVRRALDITKNEADHSAGSWGQGAAAEVGLRQRQGQLPGARALSQPTGTAQHASKQRVPLQSDEGDLLSDTGLTRGQMLQCPVGLETADRDRVTDMQHSGRRPTAEDMAPASVGSRCGSLGPDGPAMQELASQDLPEAGWAFFQPFAGGTAFVVTQALGWALFAMTVVCIVALAKALVAGMVRCLRCWLLGAGCLMVATQVILAISLMLWRARRGIRPGGSRTGRPHRHGSKVTKRPAMPDEASAAAGATPTSPRAQPSISSILISAVAAARAAVRTVLDVHAPIAVMFLPIHIFFSAWALSFTLIPAPHLAAVGWLLVLPVYYGLGVLHEPQHTGARTWPSFREWFSARLEPTLTHWFGSVQVIRDWDGPPPDPSARYIFGFHPHGLYPTGAGYLPLLPSFKRAMPGITPVTLTASVMYYVPAIKECSLWLGFRQVSRRTFVRALRDCGSVVVCPGGQAELVYAHCAHAPQSEAAQSGAPQPLPQPGPQATPVAPGAPRSDDQSGVQETVRPLVVAEPAGPEALVVPGTAAQVCHLEQHLAAIKPVCTQPSPAPGKAIPVALHNSALSGSTSTEDGPASGMTAQGVMGVTGGSPAAGSEQLGASSTSNSSWPATPTTCCHSPLSCCKGMDTDRRVSSGGAGEGEAVDAGNMDAESGSCEGAAPVCGSMATLALGTSVSAAETVVGESTTADANPVPVLTADASSTKAGTSVASTKPAPSQQGGSVEPPPRKMVIYAGHKGFVRLAIEQQACLVPVLALGEVLQLRNLIHWPLAQRWTYKKFGFPMPFVLGGRWGVVPLPARVPLVYVIGKPIPPPPLPADGKVLQADVNALHARFYDALSDMYARHAPHHPEFARTELVMLHDHCDELA